LLKSTCEIGSKFLIYKNFMNYSVFLWITLFISRRTPRKSLAHQGFWYFARKNGNFSIPYKSTTYVRYAFHSGDLPG